MRTIAFCLVLACTMTLPAAGGTERFLVGEKYYADLRVGPDGSPDLAKSIRHRFQGRWTGLARFIPLNSLTPLLVSPQTATRGAS